MKKFILTVDGDNLPTISEMPPSAVVVPPPPTLLDMRGCNLTGGDCFYANWAAYPSGPIGGTHYRFISTADVDKLILAGMNTFRLVFAWEALQPKPYSDVNVATPYSVALYGLVAHITSKGCRVLLDIHGGNDSGFAAYYGCKVGTTYNGLQVTDLFENLWWQLGTKYKSNPLVMYGLTNEPHDIAGTTWFAAAQKAIGGIRRAGATGTIIAPGINWTGAGSFVPGSSQYWNLTDPLHNLMVQLHLYMDPNSGGGTTEIVSTTIGMERCQAVTTWARSKGLKLFLGEVGLSAANPIAQQTWNNLHTFLVANRDVWAGWSFWAAGDAEWWGRYKFYCGPGSAQLGMIQGALK